MRARYQITFAVDSSCPLLSQLPPPPPAHITFRHVTADPMSIEVAMSVLVGATSHSFLAQTGKQDKPAHRQTESKLSA
ncbi:unnamed protein product [Protopolystoma xenopodis]|uniref:Uncharacterized protein n=1 Tax=Protopolystoma xenopodis TaxID=117903 RepID=A0A3S5AJP6_9PLAT|nr:unnamed protein product [Protopolystoma xenopodis]